MSQPGSLRSHPGGIPISFQAQIIANRLQMVSPRVRSPSVFHVQVLTLPILYEQESPEVLPASATTSATFHRDAKLHLQPPDLIVLSSDVVIFHVHSDLLLASSSNHFANLLPPSFDGNTILRVAELSEVLNIIFHALYGLSCTQLTPTMTALERAVRRFRSYGIEPKDFINASKPLFLVFERFTAMHAVPLYAFAGHFDLYDLAVTVSPYLLSVPLWDISDETLEEMGSVYLKRLFTLRLDRVNTLSNILLHPPPQHMDTLHCDAENQRPLTRGWALAITSLVWELQAGAQRILHITTLPQAL